MFYINISPAFKGGINKCLLFIHKQIGIDGYLLGCFPTMFSNIHQRVLLKSSVSSLKLVTAGVPHGTSLGRLLFLIFVNDISESLLSLTRLFADGSSLYYFAASINDIEGIINHGLALISASDSRLLST